jgi:hypothetical protein
MARAVSQGRCNIARECNTTTCIFKMLQLGYKFNPNGEMEKRRNAEIERVNGKGYYPSWDEVGHGEFVDLICNDYKEKR